MFRCLWVSHPLQQLENCDLGNSSMLTRLQRRRQFHKFGTKKRRDLQVKARPCVGNKTISTNYTDWCFVGIVVVPLQRESPNTRTRTWLGLPIRKHCTRIQARTRRYITDTGKKVQCPCCPTAQEVPVQVRIRASRYMTRTDQAKHCTRDTSTVHTVQ